MKGDDVMIFNISTENIIFTINLIVIAMLIYVVISIMGKLKRSMSESKLNDRLYMQSLITVPEQTLQLQHHYTIDQKREYIAVFIDKPISFEDLSSQIEKAINANSVSRPFSTGYYKHLPIIVDTKGFMKPHYIVMKLVNNKIVYVGDDLSFTDVSVRTNIEEFENGQVA